MKNKKHARFNPQCSDLAVHQISWVSDFSFRVQKVILICNQVLEPLGVEELCAPILGFILPTMWN